MADKKISELTAATTLGDTDVFPIVQGSVTKKISIETFKANLNLDAISELTISTALTVEGTTDLNSLNVTGSSTLSSLGLNSIDATSGDIDTINSLVGNIDSLNLASIQSITTEDIVNTTSSITLCTNLEVTPYVVTLGIAALPGHIQIILFDSVDISLICSAGAGWATITPTSVGSSIVLVFVGASWYILSSRNVTVT
jgi:hypothetical protein